MNQLLLLQSNAWRAWMAFHMLCQVWLIFRLPKNYWMSEKHLATVYAQQDSLLHVIRLVWLANFGLLHMVSLPHTFLPFLESPRKTGNEGKKDKSIGLIPDLAHSVATLGHILDVVANWTTISWSFMNGPLACCPLRWVRPNMSITKLIMFNSMFRNFAKMVNNFSKHNIQRFTHIVLSIWYVPMEDRRLLMLLGTICTKHCWVRMIN